jgi:hypothetical protein
MVGPWQPNDAKAVFEANQDPAIERRHVRSMTDLPEASSWISSWPVATLSQNSSVLLTLIPHPRGVVQAKQLP